MLYELIGIVRPGNLAEVKEIVLTAGQTVLRRGGVVRDVANWGVFLLPRAASRAQQKHVRGHYFCMRFDAATDVQRDVGATLRRDPRVIRSAAVRLGDGRLESAGRFGDILWEGAFKRN